MHLRAIDAEECFGRADHDIRLSVTVDIAHVRRGPSKSSAETRRLFGGIHDLRGFHPEGRIARSTLEQYLSHDTDILVLALLTHHTEEQIRDSVPIRVPPGIRMNKSIIEVRAPEGDCLLRQDRCPVLREKSHRPIPQEIICAVSIEIAGRTKHIPTGDSLNGADLRNVSIR